MAAKKHEHRLVSVKTVMCKDCEEVYYKFPIGIVTTSDGTEYDDTDLQELIEGLEKRIKSLEKGAKA